MDENFLLTIETLRLSPEVSTGVSVHGTVTLKQRKTGEYLVVNDAQRITLEAFRTPQTVPHMLGRSIFSRTCLELGEFYELILKAQRAGILSTGSQPAAAVTPKPPRKWLPVPWKASVAFSILSVLGFVGVIAWLPIVLSHQILPHLLGWVTWCASLSVGYVLAASTLKSSKGEFSGPHFARWTLAPHLSFDLSDSRLQPLAVRVAVELSLVAPLLLAAALGVGFDQPWAAIPTLGSLLALNPLTGTLGRLRLLYAKKPRLGTEEDFLFSSNRRPRNRIRAFRRSLSFSSVAGAVALALIWLVIVIHVSSRAFGMQPQDVLENLTYWKWAGISVAAVLVILLFAFFVWAATELTTRRGTRMLVRVRRRSQRWKAHRTGKLSQSEVLRAMAQSPLFRSVDMQKQVEVARRFTVTRTRAWRTLAAPGAANSDIGLIVRGSAAVSQRLEGGKRKKLRRYAEGDVFGAHTLVDPLQPQIEVRSRTPVLALTLPTKFFQERLVQQLGAGRVHNLTHVCSFLRSLPLCQHWQLSSVMRLADIASVRNYEVGEKIVLYADDPRAFYVIWEGAVQMEHGGRVIERLRAGDSFGEAELLQNSAAVADAVATARTRCLTVSRVDFIRFVTHNHHVAMSLETTSSRRLGRPIFPLQASFDVR